MPFKLFAVQRSKLKNYSVDEHIQSCINNNKIYYVELTTKFNIQIKLLHCLCMTADSTQIPHHRAANAAALA